MDAKKARKMILAVLEKAGLTGKQEKLKHRVGVHERCGTEVEFHHSPQWFIKVLDHKEDYLKRGSDLKWYPEFMKVRFDDWVKGLKWDWCISRQRYYGVPFPVWYCERCKQPLFALRDELPVDPMMKEPEGRVCANCGSKKFVPEQDVMDTWMTSSLTPLINSTWAMEDDSRHQKIYPMSIRVQAFEIIRTWLFYTVAKSHHHTGTLPWGHVMISGWGLDKSGKKMSKRAGNYVDPMDIIDKYGADALRYWSAGATLGNDLRFNEEDVGDGKRLVTKLYNATKFVAGYLAYYLIEERDKMLPNATIIDKWILSRFNETVKEVTDFLDRYEYSHALKTAERFFFADFCDNYLEIVKDRFWSPQKYRHAVVEAARHVLYEVNFGVLKLFAPFMPYITEELYQRVFKHIDKHNSIHVLQWPQYDKNLNFPQDEQKTIMMLQVLTAVRRLKTDKALHQNHPLKTLTITAMGEKRLVLEDMAMDLASAARAENIVFDFGGETDTGVEGVKISLVAGEKVKKESNEGGV